MNKETAELYAEMPAYKNLLAKTKHFIQSSLQRLHQENKIPYVSCSFGKDSSVLLHLVREFDPNIKVILICYDETELLDNYEETIAKWQGLNLEKIFVDLPIISSFTERDFIPQWALENGYHAGFVGLRKEESRARFLTLAKYGAYYECANGLVRICPLMDWKTRDVATYILQNDIPTLNTYKVTGFNTRTTNSVVSEKAHIISKQLTILKKVDIRYYKLLNKYPELRNFV